MADHQKYHFQLFLLISSCFVLSLYGFQFNVGGRQGWVVNTSENYNDWAGRLRFQINDTLLFKYSKGDSVLVVNKDDYDKCNTDKPIMKFDDGNSVFKFDRSGPFYFITGNKSNCENGQKMIVVVLAIRSRSPLPSPPGYSPPISPSPSSSGGSATPALSPSVVPTPAGSAMSPSPSSQTPVPSPEGLTPAPAMTPTSSSPSPSSPPSPLSPSTSPAGSPGLSPSGGGGSRAGAPGPNSGNTPSDIRSPTDSPAGSSATLAFTPTSAVLFSSVSFVLCGLVIFI